MEASGSLPPQGVNTERDYSPAGGGTDLTGRTESKNHIMGHLVKITVLLAGFKHRVVCCYSSVMFMFGLFNSDLLFASQCDELRRLSMSR